MPTLFDTKTREPITLQDHEIADAVATGKASFKINDVIPVISPDGTAGTLPATQIKDALADGFQIESPRQTAVREYVKSKDNLQGSAEVALKQFANQALFDVPQTALNLTDPLEAQKWEALKADHQLANAIGGVTGFGASLSYGGPLIDAAGQGAERLVAKSLADYGIKRGAETVAKDVTARIAENAARIGVESAAFATPKAATEAFNGDPELAAETLISNGAFGLGLGVLGGLAGKGLSTLTKSFNGSALEGKALNAAKTFDKQAGKFTAEGTIENKLPDEIVDDSLMANAGDKPGMFSKITKEMTSLKKNVDEIKTASEALGIEPTEGMVSGSKFIQDMDSALTKKVSQSGIKRAKKYEQIYDTLENNVRESFASNAPESALAAGDQIKALIRKGVEDRYQPFNEAYDKIKEISGGLRIPLEELNTLSQDINNFAGQQYKKYQPQIKSYAEQVLEKEGSVDNLEMVSRSLKDEISAAQRSGKYEESKILQDLKKKISDFSDQQVESQVGKLKKQGVPEANSFLMYKDVTNRGYKDFKDLMGTLSGSAKVRGHGIKDVLENLDDVASEKLVDRLFDKKNARAMQFMQKEFPEAFDIVKGFKKRQLIESTIKDGKVGLGQIFNSTKGEKLPSEIKSLIFTPEQLQKFDQARTVFESIPKDVNPSGTARGLDFKEFFNPLNPKSYIKMGGEFITDKIQENVMRSATDAYKTNGSILKTTQKTLGAFATIPQRLQKFISKSTPVSVETSSVGAIGRMLGNDAPKDRKEQLKKMNEKLSEFTQNPAMSTEHLSQITKQLQPNLAQSVTAKNVAIAQYLQNTIPKPKVPPSPFNKYTWEPSAHELSQFERRVQAVNDPTSILDSLENGSLSKEEVETAQTIYPKLFEQMQSKIIEALTDHDKPVPYSARIKLSLLMGQPFDNSLNAQVIQAYQANFNKMDQSQPSQGVEMPSMQTNIDSIATKSS